MTRLLAFFILASSSVADAQQRQPRPLEDSSVVRIMASARGRSNWLAADVMRQRNKAHAQVKINELADSLAMRAISHGAAVTDTSRYAQAQGAIAALALAGGVNVSYGTPYQGSLDRLLRISREGQNRILRATALAAMLAVPGRPRALAHLRDVAISTDVNAPSALTYLMMDANGGIGIVTTVAQQRQTTALLRELFEQDLVKDGGAAKLLLGWASARGIARR